MNPGARKRYKDIEFPFVCPLTNRSFDTSKGLSCYVTKTLKIDHSVYYDTHINHRDNSCFFCGERGLFISISKGYRNLCQSPECTKKSFNSCSVEGIMYKEMCTREEAEILFENHKAEINELKLKAQAEIRKNDPLWDKKRSRNCKEFWINKGFSEEEALKKTIEVMKEVHEKTSLKLRSNKEKYATKYPTKVEYYLHKGFSMEEARKMISERQKTFSLEICIQKYGQEVGEKVFKERQERWQKALVNNGNTKAGYSKISQVLFDSISERLDISDEEIYYWTKNKEFVLYDGPKIYLYDFTYLNRNKIIEYNGDQYHANPKIYEANDQPHPYHKSNDFTAQKIWEKDKRKIDLAKSNGFETLIIWDSDYKKNPQQVLQKCIEFING